MLPLRFCTQSKEEVGQLIKHLSELYKLEKTDLRIKRLNPPPPCQVHAKGLAFVQRGRPPSLKANQICSLHTHPFLPVENKPK